MAEEGRGVSLIPDTPPYGFQAPTHPIPGLLYLSNPFPLHSQSLHLGEIMVERDHIGDNGLLIWSLHVHILGVKERETI